jgi:proline iminopeptidase
VTEKMGSNAKQHLEAAIAGDAHGEAKSYVFQTPDALELQFTIAGSGPLLVIQPPGWGIGKQYLQGPLQPLEKQFTLLYLLPRGTLPSARPSQDALADNPKAMSSRSMAEDLEALRKYLQLEKMSLFGHSNGATIALHYAQTYPDRVEKLVLVALRLSGYDDSATWVRFMGERASDPRYESAIETIKTRLSMPKDDDDNGFGELLTGMLPYYLAHPEKNLDAFRESMGDGPPQAWAYVHQMQSDAKDSVVLEKLGEVKAKTLLIAGGKDAFCTAEQADKAAEGLKDAEKVVLENCGHVPWIEEKDYFFQTLTQFLRA